MTKNVAYREFWDPNKKENFFWMRYSYIFYYIDVRFKIIDFEKKMWNLKQTNDMNLSTEIHKKFCNELRKVDIENTPKVPHHNEMIPALVYKVYDGDTCKVIILHGYVIPMKLSIRIHGIDTPEIRCYSQQSLHPELEKKAGLFVRDYVKELLENQIVSLQILDWDKFGGRVLGTIYLPDSVSNKEGEGVNTTLTTHLIGKKFGKPYHGEKKKKFEKEELEYIINSFV